MEGWQEIENSLVQKFEFSTFTQAFAFMTAVAMEAEKMDHHPDWSNSYNTVTIRLTTHDAGNTISEKDKSLAHRISEIRALFN